METKTLTEDRDSLSTLQHNVLERATPPPEDSFHTCCPATKPGLGLWLRRRDGFLTGGTRARAEASLPLRGRQLPALPPGGATPPRGPREEPGRRGTLVFTLRQKKENYCALGAYAAAGRPLGSAARTADTAVRASALSRPGGRLEAARADRVLP